MFLFHQNDRMNILYRDTGIVPFSLLSSEVNHGKNEVRIYYFEIYRTIIHEGHH